MFNFPCQLPFTRSVVPFKIFKEAEKEGVDGHRVDSEEGRGDEVRPDDDENDRHEEVVQGGDSVSLRKQKSILDAILSQFLCL